MSKRRWSWIQSCRSAGSSSAFTCSLDYIHIF